MRWRNVKRKEYYLPRSDPSLDKITLDVGAGTSGLGTINVDVRRLPGIDILCDARHLPFKDGTVDHVFLRDVIEHFKYDDARKLLLESGRVLRKGGGLDIWTPNFQSIGFLRAWIFGSSGDPQGRSLHPPLTGNQDYPENVHVSQWSLNHITKYIRDSSLRVVEARTVGEYKGKLRIVGLFTSIFKNRGGIIYVRAAR